MVDYDKVKRREWREFVENIAFGEVAIFTVDCTGDIDTLRTVASRVNCSGQKPYMYSVEGDNNSLRVQVFTKARL